MAGKLKCMKLITGGPKGPSKSSTGARMRGVGATQNTSILIILSL